MRPAVPGFMVLSTSLLLHGFGAPGWLGGFCSSVSLCLVECCHEGMMLNFHHSCHALHDAVFCLGGNGGGRLVCVRYVGATGTGTCCANGIVADVILE